MISERRGTEAVFRADPIFEQDVIGAAMADEMIARELVAIVSSDEFLAPEHVAIWGAIREAVNRKLARDPSTLAKLANGKIEIGYLAEIASSRPTPPDPETLRFHVEHLKWDRQRHDALTGPINGLLEAIENNEPPERVRSVARSVSSAFDGAGDRKFLRDPEQLVDEQIEDVRRRMAGQAFYPFGIDGLDYFEAAGDEKPRRRLVVGAAPGLMTVVTGVPGTGKSTLMARMALGFVARKERRRRVLFGAWEMRPGTTLELLACLSLNWSRRDLKEGLLSEEQLEVLRARMTQLSKHVRFLDNPFHRQTGRKTSNDRNLDIIQSYIAESGCEIFIADLWKRCLAAKETRPDDEEEALIRQQAMLNEMGVHGILAQQQRLKDIELRPDKRPTREGIKGSGAWTEVPDNIIGVHRPALWKPVPDNVLEVDILKQREGTAPLAIEFEWDAERGRISGGTSVEYNHATTYDAPSNPIDQKLHAQKGARGRQR